MDEARKSKAKLFSVPKMAVKPEAELSDLLKDELVANFFRYVHKNDLRQEALELLEKRLGEAE